MNRARARPNGQPEPGWLKLRRARIPRRDSESRGHSGNAGGVHISGLDSPRVPIRGENRILQGVKIGDHGRLAVREVDP